MGKSNEKRAGVLRRCIGFVASRNASVRTKNIFTADCKPKALILVDAILSRGNAVKMVNVAGNFIVTELVVV